MEEIKIDNINVWEILIFALLIIGITFADLPENISNLVMVAAIISGVSMVIKETNQKEEKDDRRKSWGF